MSIYKPINATDISFRTEEVYHKHTLLGDSNSTTPLSAGNQFQSHSVYFEHPITLAANQVTQSNNYFFLKSNFYQTGSNRLNQPVNPQQNWYRQECYNHRFHSEKAGRFINIPQFYVGEEIKRKSFVLVDTSAKSSDNKTIEFRDDGYGNIYSTNAHTSQSNNHLSSSDNYVGNIFYKEGIVALTATGSWSGSLNYNSMLSAYTASFESVKRIYTRTYKLKLNANEFNMTNNPTIKKADESIISPFGPSSDASLPQPPFSITNSNLIADNISGSKDWKPYVNSIGLYDENFDLIMTANLSQPIQKRDDIDLVFEVDLDF